MTADTELGVSSGKEWQGARVSAGISTFCKNGAAQNAGSVTVVAHLGAEDDLWYTKTGCSSAVRPFLGARVHSGYPRSARTPQSLPASWSRAPLPPHLPAHIPYRRIRRPASSRAGLPGASELSQACGKLRVQEQRVVF